MLGAGSFVIADHIHFLFSLPPFFLRWCKTEIKDTQRVGENVFKKYLMNNFLCVMILSYLSTYKSLSEALLFAEHGENTLCTKIVLNVRNSPCLSLEFSCIELVIQ